MLVRFQSVWIAIVIAGLFSLCQKSPLSRAGDPPAGDAKLPDGHPAGRSLEGKAAQRVEELEKWIKECQKAGKFAEALPLAREAAEVRERVQGKGHWEAQDARRSAQDLARLAELPEADRRQATHAFRLRAEGEAQQKKARYAEAEAAYRGALEIWRSLWGENHPDTASSYYEIADTLYARNKFANAQTFYEKALTIQRRTLGETHPLTASAALDLGFNFHAQGRYAEALPFFEKALAIRRSTLGEIHPATGWGYNSVGYGLNALGRYAEAQPYYQQALAIFRQTLGEADDQTATAYNNVAFNLKDQGRYGEAQPLFEKGLAIRRKALGEDDPDTAASYNNVALNLNAQGRYAEAQPLYEKALAIRRKALGENHAATATSYSNVALNLSDQGRHAEAQPLLEKALAIDRKALGEGHPDTAASYNSVGLNLIAQGRYAEAQPLLEKALAIRRKALGENHPDTAQGYNNLAFNLKVLGRYAEAQPLYERALAGYRKALGEDHPDTATSYNNVAVNLDAQGRYAEAQPLLEKALTVFRKTLGENHPNTALSFTNVAINLKAQGRHAEAERYYVRAAAVYGVARLRAPAVGLQRATFGVDHSPLPDLAACRARLGQPAAAWQAVETGLARGLLDAVSAGLARPLAPQDRDRERQLAGRLDQLAQQIGVLVAGADKSDTTRGRLEALVRQRKMVEEELGRLEAALAEREVYKLERVQAALPEDTALLTWVDLETAPNKVDRAGDHWACLVRHAGTPVWVKLPGSGAGDTWTQADQDLAGALRQVLGQRLGERRGDVTALCQRLYEQRLAPVEAHLKGGDGQPAVRQLVVVPVWHMAGVPVEALTDRYCVSYAPSGTLLARLRERHKEAGQDPDRPAGPRLLAVGDPVFRQPVAAKQEAGPARGPAYQRLAGSRREVEAVARLFPDALVLLGPEASEQRLDALARVGDLRKFRYLHFATHGEVDDGIALNSALILSQDRLPDPAEAVLKGQGGLDGRLTAAEVCERWKLDAELVVLSACRTGLGRHAGGEGYLGLSQAFFLAGARGLVVSLWQVDDTATALLMERFYQNLLGKRPGLEKPLAKAEALREAKAWLRGLSAAEADRLAARDAVAARGKAGRAKPPNAVEGERPYADPYFWSAFILIGDPD
jgi:tetratricopeptide (TPR) repeat protein/CHAT domain-containing protein